MLIKSALVTQMSGSIGGMTGSRNSAGMYLRARSVPVNPNSPDQVTVRGLFAILSSLWRSLTDAQRDGWSNYATNTPVVNKLGDTITLSGVAWYMKVNACAGRGGLGPFSDAPVASGMSTLTEPAWVGGAADNWLSGNINAADPWALTTGGGLMNFFSRQLEPSVNFFKGPFRFVGVLLGNTATPPTNTDLYPSPFGEALVEGKVVFVRSIAVDAGGRMTNQFIQRIVVAA